MSYSPRVLAYETSRAISLKPKEIERCLVDGIVNGVMTIVYTLLDNWNYVMRASQLSNVGLSVSLPLSKETSTRLVDSSD